MTSFGIEQSVVAERVGIEFLTLLPHFNPTRLLYGTTVGFWMDLASQTTVAGSRNTHPIY